MLVTELQVASNREIMMCVCPLHHWCWSKSSKNKDLGATASMSFLSLVSVAMSKSCKASKMLQMSIVGMELT
jgi:hypothetical protein